MLQVLSAYHDAALPVLALAAISCIARVIHYRYFEVYFKLTFADAPVWSLLYFGAWTGVVWLAFPGEMSALFGTISITGYVLLTFCLLGVFPFMYHVMRKRFGSPKWLAELFPGQGMLTLEERYIVAKIGDVIFQQSIAGGIVLFLAQAGASYPAIVLTFIVLFAIAHLYIFRTAGFFWGMHYTMYAALAGFAFPFLILFVAGGIGYAIILHMLFYVLSAAYFAKMPHPKNRQVLHDLHGMAPAA
ncbi:MAG TPA: hypothetical protein VFL98_02440 [Candidatus Paceibacterota bacterium]|nr:hypothetical protein [Candidatus Paceibacterota bacterium]